MDKRKKTIQYNQYNSTYWLWWITSLSSTEIRHSLCRWIITHFNIAHCRLDIGQERQFPITCSDVGEILGIPYIGRRLLLSPTNRNNRMENLSDLRDRLILMEDMAEFKKLFIFFSCATLLAPTSKLDGSHELWCTLLVGDFDINVNWGQFVLDTLVAGIRHFRLGKGSWFTGCLIFLQLFYVNKFYIPTMLVPRTIPISYGSPLNDRFADGEDNVGPSTSQPAAQHSIEDEVQMNAIIPYETGHPPIRSYRLRRHATALQSPYVVQPSIKFSASSSVAKQVLAYALDDTRDESQILCSMHNFFLTRFDLKCLGPDKLVDNKVNVLSTVIGIQERRPSMDMMNLNLLFEVVQQLNCKTDCGIFVMKFMQLWSNGGISRAIANVLYCGE
ncbi:hypothetical protein AAG906_025921 [Vitis piasezkii]